MSKDKRKKRDRAFVFLRSLGTCHAVTPCGDKLGIHRTRCSDRQRIFSGPMTDTMRYCVERGLAVVRRQRRDAVTNRRNVFDAELDSQET